MQLLVSVRAADEVEPALAGGADIVDAKEPDRGPLGSVDRKVAQEILRRVPEERSVSLALSDVTNVEEVLAALRGLTLPARAAPTYLKFGFAGVSAAKRIRLLIETAVLTAGQMPGFPRIIAVGYADSERARTISAEQLPALASDAGAAGVLLDTHDKRGLGLLDWVAPGALVKWVASSRRAGLLTALAGSLSAGDLALVCAAGPDVVGIRGAACRGGRSGRISEERVRRFRLALEWADRGMMAAPVGETRDTGAIS